MKKTKAFSLVVVLTVSSLLLSAATARAVSEEAQRSFDRGMAAVEMANSPEDYAPAITEFEQAIKLAPDWPEAYYNLGLIQEKAGKYRDAAKAFRQYLQLAPDSPDAAAVRSLANKAEFKAEQVITDEDVLDIFGSLGDGEKWQLKGATPDDSPAPDQLRGMQLSRRDGSQIVIAYWSRNDKTETRRVTPQGRTLSFDTIYYLCPPSVQGDMCPDVSNYRLEVVSKRKVKMSRKRFGPEIKPYVAATLTNHFYEYVRK